MVRRWLYVRIDSPSELEADLLAEGLVASGAGGIEQDGSAVVAYLPDEGVAAERRVADLRARLAALLGHEPELAWEWREDEDWAREWRRGLEARRVGQRLVLTPTWIEPDTRPDDIIIRIDPQMAFGTGEHATTRGVLRLMEPTVSPGARVLDVGTGSGVLAIAAVRLGAAHALAVENDPDALINAAENVARNGTGDSVQLREDLVDAAFLAPYAASFDLILANVLSSVLRPLLGAFRAALRPDGALILSGILQEEAEGMIASASAAGFVLADEVREEEWWTGLLRAAPPSPETAG